MLNRPRSKLRISGEQGQRLRVLYSFPHKLGAGRICSTAWHQVDGLAAAGAEVIAFPASFCRRVAPGVDLQPTLARGPFRLPNKLLTAQMYFALHDYIVSRRLEYLRDKIDIVHVWPLGALRTMRTAKRLGIPTVLERCNAHTRVAYEVVSQECRRLGVGLPENHEHAFNARVLRAEEEEYDEAHRLLCPSEFVVKTFLDQGFSKRKLLRHVYGFDPARFYAQPAAPSADRGLMMLFVGVNAVRKGLHFALEAWLHSPASLAGRFLIAGDFTADYAKKLAPMLDHPRISVLGHRNDVPQLMRSSDILILPSLEEGSALVVGEAMASGCVPVISDRAAGVCEHLQTGLIHPAGDVATLQQHISLLDENRALLQRLKEAAIERSRQFTWNAAGRRLLEVYRQALDEWDREQADSGHAGSADAASSPNSVRDHFVTNSQ